MPKVMLELTPFFSQLSHQVSLVLTCGCSETPSVLLQSWNLSQHQVWVSAPSLSGDSLALAFLPGQEDVVVQGEGTPTC